MLSDIVLLSLIVDFNAPILQTSKSSVFESFLNTMSALLSTFKNISCHQRSRNHYPPSGSLQLWLIHLGILQVSTMILGSRDRSIINKMFWVPNKVLAGDPRRWKTAGKNVGRKKIDGLSSIFRYTFYLD